MSSPYLRSTAPKSVGVIRKPIYTRSPPQFSLHASPPRSRIPPPPLSWNQVCSVKQFCTNICNARVPQGCVSANTASSIKCRSNNQILSLGMSDPQDIIWIHGECRIGLHVTMDATKPSYIGRNGQI
jgi:hypothetical protein